MYDDTELLLKSRLSERVCQSLGKSDYSQQSSKNQSKILLIDDDPVYLAIMRRSAKIEGIKLDTFLSLEDFGSIWSFINYDAVILDFDLGFTNALEIAHYSNIILKHLPILIISGKDRSQECWNSPTCVKSILNKAKGYSFVLQVALRFSQEGTERLA